MTQQQIPAEAVEAVRKVAFERYGTQPDAAYVRTLLTAAAPYMMAGLRGLVEDMERQSWSEIATVPGMAALIRSTVGDMLNTNPYRSQA